MQLGRNPLSSSTAATVTSIGTIDELGGGLKNVNIERVIERLNM